MYPEYEEEDTPYRPLPGRTQYEEGRTSYLELAYGVELKVDAWVKGWSEDGDMDTPPCGEEEIEVTGVSLLAFGRVVDLLPIYQANGSDDLFAAVAEALEIIA